MEIETREKIFEGKWYTDNGNKQNKEIVWELATFWSLDLSMAHYLTSWFLYCRRYEDSGWQEKMCLPARAADIQVKNFKN